MGRGTAHCRRLRVSKAAGVAGQTVDKGIEERAAFSSAPSSSSASGKRMDWGHEACLPHIDGDIISAIVEEYKEFSHSLALHLTASLPLRSW
jgi:hypothetical protein